MKAKARTFVYAVSLFILYSLIISKSNAQGKVHGSVIDMNGLPLINSNVYLLNPKDSSLVKGLITTKEGLFVFDRILPGKYLIASSYVGFKQVYSPVFNIKMGDDINVRVLKLTEREPDLKEVTVATKKPLFEQKIDRMVINVSSSIINSGSTALDVLIRSPGVMLDPQNNTLSMNGKDGVVVMINGKINRMPISAVIQLLEGMSSGNIEKIELITTPPARYEAEGNAGFINIVMKTNTQYGTNGSYSATIGYGKKWVGAASLNFNHRKGRFNIFGDYSFSDREVYLIHKYYRKSVNQGKAIENYIDGDRDVSLRTHNARFGVDYELNKKTIIGVLLSGFQSRWFMKAHNQSDILLNGKLDTIINIAYTEYQPKYNYGANINLVHNFANDKTISANIEYIFYEYGNPIDYHYSYKNSNGNFLYDEKTISRKSTPISFWVANTDYTRKINKNVDLETGIKGTLSHFSNDVHVEKTVQGNWLVDDELTKKFDLNESIGAAYASFNIKMNEKTRAKMGLRFEYTNSNLGSLAIKNIVDRHYGSWFPSLFISRAIDSKNSINFSYSRRITRPSFFEMAPFVNFVDPNTLFTGNPALQPSISDAVKTDYIFKKIIFSLAYTYQAKPITIFTPTIDPVTNKQILYSANQKNKKIASLIITVPVNIGRRWTMQNNVTGIWQQLNAFYKSKPLQIQQTTFNLNSTQTFQLPWNFSMELTGYYQSKSILSMYVMKARGSLDIGLQKKLPGKKGTLKMAVTEVFGPPHYNIDINNPEQNLVFNANFYLSNTTVRLTYTHNFGNDKIREKRSRITVSEEERQRVN